MSTKRIPKSWTETKRTRQWLHDNNAYQLGHVGGFFFFENPLTGDTSPILAVVGGAGAASMVYNTQAFDVPYLDEIEEDLE